MVAAQVRISTTARYPSECFCLIGAIRDGKPPRNRSPRAERVRSVSLFVCLANGCTRSEQLHVHKMIAADYRPLSFTLPPLLSVHLPGSMMIRPAGLLLAAVACLAGQPKKLVVAMPKRELRECLGQACQQQRAARPAVHTARPAARSSKTAPTALPSCSLWHCRRSREVHCCASQR